MSVNGKKALSKGKLLNPIESSVNPAKKAGGVAAAYLVLGTLYILFSSRMAALMAGSRSELSSIETVKGMIFIGSTTVLLFIIVYYLLLRVRENEQRLLNFGNRLIAAERRATAGIFADSVAYEINNVLMPMSSFIEELEERLGPGEDIIQKLRSSHSRLTRLVRGLGKAGGQYINGKKDYFDLIRQIRSGMDFVKIHKKVKFCDLQFHGPATLMFMGNPLLIQQMIINLVLNAAEATEHHGIIQIRLSDENHHVRVSVSDNGPGIAPGDREKLLAPFSTSKAGGKGLGLLSVIACAEAHNGEIRIRESEMGGACFEVFLEKGAAVIGE